MPKQTQCYYSIFIITKHIIFIMDSTNIICKRVTRFIPYAISKYGDFTRILQEHFIIFKVIPPKL